MKTTNFTTARNLKQDNIVSIALKSAQEFHGHEYKKLAPPWWILSAYRMDHDKTKYTPDYQLHVLDKLDAKQVYLELGEDAILCCYERKGVFCHRRLVADWFYQELGDHCSGTLTLSKIDMPTYTPEKTHGESSMITPEDPNRIPKAPPYLLNPEELEAFRKNMDSLSAFPPIFEPVESIRFGIPKFGIPYPDSSFLAYICGYIDIEVRLKSNRLHRIRINLTEKNALYPYYTQMSWDGVHCDVYDALREKIGAGELPQLCK